MNGNRLLVYLPVLIAVALGIYPAVYLIFGSLWSADPGYPGHLTAANLETVAADPTLGGILYNTVVFVVCSAVFAVVLATLISLAVQRTDAPFKRLISYSMLLVLALPWFVEDISWNFLMEKRTGLYNIALSGIARLFHHGGSLLGGEFVNVNSLGGMIWVMGLSLTPLAYLVISPALSQFDSRLEESSRISGASLRETFLRIDLPMAMPSILSAALLCLVFAVESFDVAEIVGVPGGVYVLASTVYRYAGGQLIPQDGLAATYALIMVAMTMAAIAVYSWSVRASQRYVTISSASGKRQVFSLGRGRALVGLSFIAFVLVYPVSVIGTLLFASFQFPVWSPLSASLNAQTYIRFFSYPDIGGAAWNTVVVGLMSAVATLALSTWLAHSANRRGGKLGRAAELLSALPLAFPTIVLGIGLLWALVFLPLPVYGTIWAFVLAYTTRYVPVISRFLSGPVMQVSSDLEEASRTCGAGFVRTMRSIVLPLLKPSLLVAAVYVLIVTAKDLGAAVMLSTTGSSMFAAALFYIYSDEPVISTAGGVLFVTSLATLLLVATLVFKIDLFSVFKAEKRSAS